jgi:cobalt-precorrin-5B (C1)-methyltransferase
VATFQLQGQSCDATSATCFVVKDAGSDPDVTHGAEIHATISLTPASSPGAHPQLTITGGAGIGRVTKPGLAVAVGQWAINPVPHKMIMEAVQEVFTLHSAPVALHCQVSIPNGEQLAKKTLNERLGIMGGLSILGTTGIVTPISARAWTDTIDTSIDVARAGGTTTVVLSTGRSSELVAQKHLASRCRGARSGTVLPVEAYVMMGDYVGHALRACNAKGVQHLVLAGQFAKLLKIACGHEQTHVSSSELDLETLRHWLLAAGHQSVVTGPWCRFNTARQVLTESGHDQTLLALVCTKARAFAQHLAPAATVQVLLVGYTSEVLYFA